jgi:hypothetical protein
MIDCIRSWCFISCKLGKLDALARVFMESKECSIVWLDVSYQACRVYSVTTISCLFDKHLPRRIALEHSYASVIVRISVCVPRPSVRRVYCCGTCAAPCVLLRLCQTKSPAMAVRSFREARGAWPCLSSSAAAYHWDLVGDCAEGIEYQVVNDKYSPWTDHYKAKDQLIHLSVWKLRHSCSSLLTNIRVSHVSTVEKLAGRIDNNPIVR